jgi:hypothetical protein
MRTNGWRSASSASTTGYALDDGRAPDDRNVTSLYEYAGGDEGLHRVEESFCSKVLADPVLKSRSPSGDRITSIT